MRRPPTEHEWMHEVGANNIPRVSYTTVISTLGFAASVVYGIWAFNQTQIANLEKQIERDHAQFQNLVGTNREELSRRETELKATIANIETELARRRTEFVGQDEFKQHSARVLNDIQVIRDRVMLLEQTRPSASELQATTSALKDRIEKLYELIRAQEEWIRTRPPHPGN